MKSIDINNLKVASPCHVPWDSMVGNDRVRRCEECHLNIYNTAEMTADEVRGLIEQREGRLCIRLYRRNDGTVLTKDCPVGLRSVRKRLVRISLAMGASILGLFSISFGQKKPFEKVDAAKLIVSKPLGEKTKGSSIKGTVTDPNGAVIPGMSLFLFTGEETTKSDENTLAKTVTDQEGRYVFPDLSERKYRIEVQPSYGFKKLVVLNIEVPKDRAVEMNLSLTLKTTQEVVGIFAEEPMIDTRSSSVTTTITRRQIETIPH